MARKFTGKEFHGVIDEGRTGRIIARRVMRRALGNPKKRVADLQAFAMDMYIRGFQQGGADLLCRIQNSVAGLTYGEGYYVAPTLESEEGQGRENDPVVAGDSGCDSGCDSASVGSGDSWAGSVAARVSHSPDIKRRFEPIYGHFYPEAGDVQSS